MTTYADSHVEFIHHPHDDATLPDPSFTHNQITSAMVTAVRPQLLFLACYVEAGDDAWERLLWVVDTYLKIITESNWNLLRTVDDFDSQRINIILHVENAVAIRNDAADLAVLHERGIRSIGLTHNQENQYAGGSLTEDQGLKDRGRQLITLAIQKGWIIDAAHLSTAAVRDLHAEWPDRPLFISHCGIRAAHESPRNIPDEVLDMVRESDGYVGVGCAGSFLSDTAPTIDDYLRQIEYAVQKVGVGRVGIGSDLGGVISSLPEDLRNIDDLQKIGGRLPAREILGENLVRFITRK